LATVPWNPAGIGNRDDRGSLSCPTKRPFAGASESRAPPRGHRPSRHGRTLCIGS